MELKELTMQDMPEIREKFLHVFTAEPWCDDWSDGKQLDDYLEDLMGQSNSLTLGYMDEGSIAALSMGRIKHWYTGTEYFIDELFVYTPYQGKGVGSAFISAMKDYLRDNGIKHIFLLTDRDVPAYNFYLKNGFEEMDGIVSFAAATD